MKNQTKKQKRWAGAGILTAFAASLCCITPVLAVVAGVSGIASTFSWLEPLRPVFIAVTVLVLGFAWYQQLKPKKEIECDCEENGEKSFWQSKKFLIIITIAAALLLTFPYYAQKIFPAQRIAATTVLPVNLQNLELQIEGMTCTGCEVNVNNAVSKVAGVLEVKSDYKTGKATVKFDDSKTTVNEIIGAVNATGYKVVGKNIVNERENLN